jgi:predicted metal-binding protein
MQGRKAMEELLIKVDHVRNIPLKIDPDLFEKDIKTLCEKAIDSGAYDTAVVSSREIIFSPEILKKVSLQDSYPSIHWPLDYPKDNIEEAVRAYEKGILFCVESDEKMPDYKGGPIDNPRHRELFFAVYEIVSILESISFYMGHHLATGFAAGNCRSVFCQNEKRCAPMLRGKPCIHPNKGRPSMEAAGMDFLSMAKNAGWDTDGNRSLLIGLLMVA